MNYYLYNPSKNVTYYNHRETWKGWEPVLFTGEFADDTCAYLDFEGAKSLQQELGPDFEIRRRAIPCDCGGHKARTSHSHWCSTQGGAP